MYDKNIVLDGISYVFEENKIYGILGNNGAVKTTLLNCISNSIKFEGKVIFEDTDYMVSYVTSPPSLPDFLTPKEILDFFLDKDSTEVLEDLQIKTDDRNQLIKNCSLGTKNKISFYLCLNSTNKVILLDEPFINLDYNARKVAEKQLKEKRDVIVIISTHDFELANDFCDELLLLKNGKLKLIDKNKMVNLNEIFEN